MLTATAVYVKKTRGISPVGGKGGERTLQVDPLAQEGLHHAANVEPVTACLTLDDFHLNKMGRVEPV